jgi:glutathione S-transferase
MYAPVVMRFNTWQPALSETSSAYMRRVMAVPAVKAWIDDAFSETHAVAYLDECR